MIYRRTRYNYHIQYCNKKRMSYQQNICRAGCPHPAAERFGIRHPMRKHERFAYAHHRYANGLRMPITDMRTVCVYPSWICERFAYAHHRYANGLRMPITDMRTVCVCPSQICERFAYAHYGYANSLHHKTYVIRTEIHWLQDVRRRDVGIPPYKRFADRAYIYLLSIIFFFHLFSFFIISDQNNNQTRP